MKHLFEVVINCIFIQFFRPFLSHVLSTGGIYSIPRFMCGGNTLQVISSLLIVRSLPLNFSLKGEYWVTCLVNSNTCNNITNVWVPSELFPFGKMMPCCTHLWIFDVSIGWVLLPHYVKALGFCVWVSLPSLANTAVREKPRLFG